MNQKGNFLMEKKGFDLLTKQRAPATETSNLTPVVDP